MEHRQYYKMSHYEGSARVPLIISGPGFPEKTVKTGLASLIDIYPTLLQSAGIPLTTPLDGQSLLLICGENCERALKIYINYKL